MSNHTKYHFLSDLISTLEADGFVVGTGKHLQLQELLTKLPEDLQLESLKTLLCPIFATNRQDQTRFYELFDLSLKRVWELQQPIEKLAVKKPLDVEIWRNVVLALFLVLAGWAGYILDWSVFKWWGNPTFLLLVALAIGGTYFSFQAFAKWWQRLIYIVLLVSVVAAGQLLKRWMLPKFKATTEYVVTKIESGSTTTLAVPLEEDKLINVTLCNGSSADTSATLGSYFVDSIGNFTLVAKDSFTQAIYDQICVLAFYENITDTTYFVIQYDPPTMTEPQADEKEAAVATLDTLPIPFPRDIAELQIDPDQQAKAEFYQKNAWWLKLLIVALFGAILWSIAQWRERKRRRLVAQLEQRDKPPYVWNVQSEQAEELLFGDNARIVLNQLRRRRLDDAYKLDVGKTVEATVRSAGRVAFQFKRQTSPPEYLLLIDQHGLNDHRAQLFDKLYQVFKLNEVNVVRFFYHGDPRLCFNRRYPNGLNIKELQHRFGDARLLIIGNGYELLSPGSGKLSKWAGVFTNWRERALFTPKPISTWDRREAYLSEYFYLMPASIESMSATLEEFSSLEPRRPDELISGLEDVQWRPIEVEGDIVSTLRKHYDERMVQWIAACAVYPQLQWDITLFLGREFSSDGNSLLTLENLLKITQLPWFVEGKIPDAAREELLDYLAAQGLEQRIRERLHGLFEHAPKPGEDSVAYDEYRINSLGNEWRFTQNRIRRRELEEELSRYYAAGHTLDTVVFKYLNRERSRLDFEAPASWKKRIFHNGDAFLGLKQWVWAMPVWVLLTMVVLFYNPKYELCQGERILYQDKELCLTQVADYLLYYEYQIREAIAKQNLATADSLLNYARQNHYTTGMMETIPGTSPETPITEATRPVSVDTVPFLRNLAVYYYNAGVGFYNEWQRFQDSIRLELDQEQTLPQQQENISLQQIQLLKYQEWNRISDSLAGAGCENFRRGSALFTNVTKGVGYDFVLAMQKICVEAPTTAPAEETFRGQVTDADTDRPIANVSIKALNGNIVAQTGRDGYYELTLPAEMSDSLIPIDFAAEGYADRTENLRLRDPIQPVKLEKLQTKPETIEIFTAKNGLKGLQTSSGKQILPARYNNIELDPASGLYRVQIVSKLDLRMGYLNDRGEEVIPVEYRVLGFLRDGRILAAKERYGYLDRNGNIAISFIYEGASDFSKGEAEVIQLLEGQRFKFIINKDGRCIRSCPPEEAYIKQKSVEQVKISENIETIELYFDAGEPSEDRNATTTVTYSTLFAELFSRKKEYDSETQIQQNQAPDDETVDKFFSNEVQANYYRFNEILEMMASYLKNSNGQVEITLIGHASTNSTSVFNQLLSIRRIGAVKNSIISYNNGELREYVASDRLKIKELPVGDAQTEPRIKNALKNLKNLRNLPLLKEQRVEVIVRFAN